MPKQHVPDEFEDRLRTLLARTAEAIPTDTDLSARVRQAHARGTQRSGVAGSRPVLATIAALLVVALLAGVLTFARPGGGLLQPAGGATRTPTATATSPVVVVPPVCTPTDPNQPGLPSGPLVDHSVAIGRQASVHGITVTLDRAYADATQTVITYHIQAGANPTMPEFPILLDAHGGRYANISGSAGQDGGTAIFAPLPPEKLDTPQLLTFFTQRMQSGPQQYQVPTPPGPITVVDGPWQIPFSLTPVAGTSVALNSPPITHNGLTIQPLRLDVAPSGGGLDGATGGERVLLRLSGLAPGMHLSDPADFAIAFPLGLGGSAAASCGSRTLALVLPDGQPIPPGFVQPVGLIVATTDAEVQAQRAQTVGPSGTVDLEAVFFAPIPPGASVILYLDNVQAQIAGAAKSTSVKGPWQFQLPPTR